MGDVIPFPTKRVEDYFGGCPKCGKNDGCFNIYSDHWYYCSTHRVRWTVGSNLFSGWKYETDEIWRLNWARFGSYRVVKPLPCDTSPVDPPSGGDAA
jgi:hypothetical protein